MWGGGGRGGEGEGGVYVCVFGVVNECVSEQVHGRVMGGWVNG